MIGTIIVNQAVGIIHPVLGRGEMILRTRGLGIVLRKRGISHVKLDNWGRLSVTMMAVIAMNEIDA